MPSLAVRRSAAEVCGTDFGYAGDVDGKGHPLGRVQRVMLRAWAGSGGGVPGGSLIGDLKKAVAERARDADMEVHPRARLP